MKLLLRKQIIEVPNKVRAEGHEFSLALPHFKGNCEDKDD
jgi:hypothetical protein